MKLTKTGFASEIVRPEPVVGIFVSGQDGYFIRWA